MAGTYNLPGVEIMFWMCLLQYWRFRLLYISVSMSPNLIECSLLCVICTYNLPGVEIMFWMRVFYLFFDREMRVFRLPYISVSMFDVTEPAGTLMSVCVISMYPQYICAAAS
jgi:hypothetical protein